MSARLKVLARKASSGVQGILRSRIEALPRLLQAPPTLSIAPRGGFYLYVDRENGSDETGDGSKEKPFRSYERLEVVCVENGYRVTERGLPP